MKKFLLAVSALFLVSAVFAQGVERTTSAKNVPMVKKTITGRETATPENVIPMMRSTSRSYIGQTFYDLQTNGSMAPKMVAHNDGTISTVWTTNGMTASTRGTGYNYFNGTSWINDASNTDRIESVRSGWGTLTCVGDAEIVASHNGTTALVINICPQKGTNNWIESTLQGPAVSNGSSTSTCLLWPMLASSGNVVHLIACTESDAGYLYQGIQTCLVYYRGVYDAATSTIAWENPRIVGNVTSSEISAFSGDAYSIAAKGNTVAIFTANTSHDAFIWKSTDNGVNFTKTVVAAHPYPGYNESTTLVTDTPYVADGACAVAIDDQGKCHVAFGLTRLLNNDLTDGTYSYFPGVCGLLYWNEDMQPILNTSRNTLDPDTLAAAGYQVFFRSDLTGDGHAYFANNAEMPSYGVSAVSVPQLIAENGTVYLIYTQLLDFPFLDVDAGAYYRGIFGTKSTDNGSTWNGATSWLSYNNECFYLNGWDWTVLQEGDSFTISDMRDYVDVDGESMFPAVAPKVVNGKINMWWQYDYTAGSEIKENSSAMCQNEAFIYYFSIDANEIGIYNNTEEVCQGLWIDSVGIANQTFSGMKMYPNPASESVNITFSSEEGANAVLSVMNLMGQTVYNMDVEVYEGYNMVTLPVNELPAGVYMVNIRSNKGTTTQKLIVR